MNSYIAEETSLVPIGMVIGPFSLMTKLLADPITPVTLAGMGVTADEDDAVLAAERCLQLAEHAVSRSIGAQIRAGARALLVCEPAANLCTSLPVNSRPAPTASSASSSSRTCA